jgi:uncharacterized membrane protein HdeD (DUF308 family)
MTEPLGFADPTPDRRSTESPSPLGVPPFVSLLADSWGLVLAYGVVTLGFGLVLALWPDETLKVVAVLIGIQLIVTGAFRLVLALASSALDGGARAVLGLLGGLAVVVGLLFLRDPMQTLLAITLILGVWWLASGLVDIIGAVLSPNSPHRGWDMVLGLVSVLAGGFLLVNPELSLNVLVFVICVWLFAYGLFAVVAAFQLRRLSSGRMTARTTETLA